LCLYPWLNLIATNILIFIDHFISISIFYHLIIFLNAEFNSLVVTFLFVFTYLHNLSVFIFHLIYFKILFEYFFSHIRDFFFHSYTLPLFYLIFKIILSSCWSNFSNLHTFPPFPQFKYLNFKSTWFYHQQFLLTLYSILD